MAVQRAGGSRMKTPKITGSTGTTPFRGRGGATVRVAQASSGAEAIMSAMGVIPRSSGKIYGGSTGTVVRIPQS